MKKPSRRLKILVVLLKIVPWTLFALVLLFFGSYVPKNLIESVIAFASAIGLGIPAVFSILVDIGYYFEYCVNKKKRVKESAVEGVAS